ncbi:cation:proton antiporter [Nannocystis punicea]|uniref:Cation:proton antiporter n=1 Tax=Nannocystis punicea TaxID=2995304 RepID=A0ABY7H6Q4_9BACT|nr:cation:proton antiporter [Nannocystis poenicansa]WAS94951.1 cation:proton antiporter [Nannocystis poenicansa]
MAPVTVFLVAIACLLAAAAAVRPLALRTNVPEAVWLIALGVVLRTTGLVPPATIAALAPFFAAIALIMVLFEAGRDMVFGAASEQVGRARKLALAGAALVVPLVALFSQALSGLQLLPVWSWTHAFMLGALLLCTAPEVYAPTLYRRSHPGLVAALEREAALTGALAIAATAFCIDLLSLRVPVGKAYAAIAAGFGLGLAFGTFAGLLWITAIRRIGPGRGVYPYTLAAILALYVVTDTLGGIGALAVLVFGAVVSNAGPLVAALFRPRGAVVEAADEDFRAALDDHARTVEITRVLLFTFLGMNLGPPWGLLAMGIVLGLLLVVLRLLAARLVLRGVDERTFSTLALGWPRGMLVAGLAALPHAAAVPGTESLTTLVFAAVATTCVAFGVAVSPLGHVSGDIAEEKGPSGHVPGDMSVRAEAPRAVAPASTVEEVLGGGSAGRSAGERGAALAGGREGRGATGIVSSEPSVGANGMGPAGATGLSGEDSSESDADVRVASAGEAERWVPVEGPTLSGGSTVSERLEGMEAARGTAVPEGPVVSGRTVVPEGPAVIGTTLPVEGPVVSGRTVVPEGPAVIGTTLPVEGPVVSGRTLPPEGPAVIGTTLPAEGPVVSGKTLPPEGPVVTGTTLLPGESGSGRRGLFAVDMPPGGRAPGEPLVGPRTLLPGEPAPATRSAEVPRFAPPGAPRSSERTVLRGSGAGAPELVRHVFISAPAGTTVTHEAPVLPVTRAAESTLSTRAIEPPETKVTKSIVPGTPQGEGPESPAPSSASGLEVAVTFVAPEPAASEGAKEPALLELVGEALLPSGHGLKNLIKTPGDGGAKEG